MAYRYDKNLEFLAHCEDKDLNDLVYVLTHDTDGKLRYTEELTNNDNYKKYYPRHSRYWQDIAGELQCYGAHGFARLFRGGKGVEYFEILCDVYKKITGKNANTNYSAKWLEDELLMFIFKKAVNEMSPNDLKKLSKDLNLNSPSELAGPALLAAAQAVFKMGGFKSYQLTLIIVNAISRAFFSRGLAVAANAGIARAAGVLTGPLGLAITGIWTAIDLAGPAYRVTIPAVIQVALLRKKEDLSKEDIIRAIQEEFDIDGDFKF